MTMVVVFGGGGFLGQRLVGRLTAEGMSVRVAVRHPDPARIKLRAIGFDLVTVVPTDVSDSVSVADAVAGADAVVNTVSAYVEKGNTTFEAVHVRGAETVAREAVAAGVARLVLLVSAPILVRVLLTSVPVDAANRRSGKPFRRPQSSARAPCSARATPCLGRSLTFPAFFR
jgi:uncharacterized protein YbjT (DUF2867 family)